jgi:hypothetical protein
LIQTFQTVINDVEWVEHYKSLLNGDSSTYSSYGILDKDTIPCPLDFPFTCSEIKKRIHKLKNGKKEDTGLILKLMPL